ncbi:capsular polysaccharide export protein, LipB/KpsS family [Rheinheimera baltica]|uniref:capsular polysaccharide export protein, LipB/KpsS family n=1 Tax=Rheinheimera baltica TaxID=67576 RepID=UPI00273D7D06|nr:hypothetical protein [Rheinheimera baltica]MDP5190182.1 hypothetical protein [Rheinheimera baltica]
MTNHYLTVSRALANTPGLAAFLGAPVRYLPAWCCWPVNTKQHTMLAWGRKASAEKAEKVAQRCNIAMCYLEDAFLRSVGQGFDSAPCGLVMDDVGIYYDARLPSKLEQLIVADITATERTEAETLPTLWQQHRVSKYNNGQDYKLLVEQPYVLLIDQTLNDASVACGLASAESFANMLQFAKETFAGHKLIVKTHPDVVAGKKRGYLTELAPAALEGVQLVSEKLHVVALIEHASAVLTVTSQVGFEALMWQKPVYVFGMPFYAGWGLTHDMQQSPQRRQLLRQQTTEVDIARLAYAALIRYGRYILVETEQACSFYQLLQLLGKGRADAERPTRRLSTLR